MPDMIVLPMRAPCFSANTVPETCQLFAEEVLSRSQVVPGVHLQGVALVGPRRKGN